MEIRQLSWQEGLADHLQRSYSLVVGEISDKGQLDILENLRMNNPETWVGPYFQKAPVEVVRRAFNSTHFKFFLEGSPEETLRLLESNLERQGLSVRKKWLLKEYYQRNKSLESLTGDLEQMVLERTLHLEQSNRDQTEKNQNERLLIRFIKEMASVSGVEDVLTVVRREIKKFHRVGEPWLCLQGDFGTEIYHFRGGLTQRLSLEQAPAFLHGDQLVETQISKDLADLLERPFAKSVVIPLPLKSFPNSKALLGFEHSMKKEELRDFESFLSERQYPVSVSLDRILLEQELNVFSYRWETTFDGIRDPLAIIDLNLQLLRSNKKFITGARHDSCHATFAGIDKACAGCPLPAAMAEGRPRVAEIKAKNRIYEVRTYPIFLQAGEQPTSFVNQYVDVTDSKDLYARMLQNEKMGAIGTLAGHIAHELNNPLTGIRSLSQILLSETQEEQVQKDLEEIEKAAARCQNIIKNLLDFTNEQDTQRESTNLDETVERTLPMLKTALRQHRLHLDLNTRGEKLMAFPHLLQQVVFNLVNNACQAMKQNGDVFISTQRRESPLRLELVIKDSGPGMTNEQKGRVFEAFFTTKPLGEGTGLGLSISKKIIERCGGSISFQSEVGKGTQFLIQFPLEEK